MISRFSKAEKIFLFHLSLDVRVGNGESLNILIDKVSELLNDNTMASNLFKLKLLESGYYDIHKPLYDERGYTIRQENIYRVTGIYTNDRLFTGSGSTAVVNIKNKQKFTVEPNSLIVLSSRENTIDIELKDGGFLGEVQKGVKLVVRQKGRITEINGEDTIVKLNSTSETSMKIVVLQGEARVKTSDVIEVPPSEKNVAQSDIEKETRSKARNKTRGQAKYE